MLFQDSYCLSWFYPSCILVEALPQNTRVIILSLRALILPLAMGERKWHKQIFVGNVMNVLPRFFCLSWLCPSHILVEALPQNTRVFILKPRAQILPSTPREIKWQKHIFARNFVNVLPRFSLFELVVPKLQIDRVTTIELQSHQPKAVSSNLTTCTERKKMALANFCQKCCECSSKILLV